VPADDVGREVEWLFAWLHREAERLRHDWPSLPADQRPIRLAILLGHFAAFFIRIHPFLNGNGRLSRLLIAWGMMRFGFRMPMTVHIRPPGRKYSSIMAAAMDGDPRPLQYFLLENISRQQTRAR